MAFIPFLLLLCTNLLTLTPVSLSTTAYPSVPDATTTDCSISDEPIRREVYGDGRIIDITHRVTKNLPTWPPTEEGLGEFLWWPISMKKGNLTNNSIMKLPTHTGTHVDAPGHVFDHYFDAGYDIDTLDLDVLNGKYKKPKK